MHYIDMCIRDVALQDRLWIQPEHEPTNNPVYLSPPFGTSSARAPMLWDLLKCSKTFLRSLLNLPDPEIPQVTVFTLARLCAALSVLPKSVSALLKLVMNGGGGTAQAPGKITPSQRSEAQAIVDEADYLSLVAALLKKLDIKIQGLAPADMEVHVVGSLCSRMRLLAHCYPYRVKGILGVDLVYNSTATTTNQPGEAGTVNSVTATSINQDDSWAGLVDSQVWPHAYPAVEDGAFTFDDAQWASVLNSFNSFV